MDFQAPFTELAKAFGAEDVAFVNGADDHLSEYLWLGLAAAWWG